MILDKLGQGGMGLVLKAEHKRMKRLVALKVLTPKVTKTPESVRRFQREVEAAARLEHPNIVTVFDHQRKMLHGCHASALSATTFPPSIISSPTFAAAIW